MGKQKIVMKVAMEDSKKRSKALKTAVGSAGVISASFEGDKIVVTGEGIDSVFLTKSLRKRMGFAELVSVGDAEEKKEEKKEPVESVVPAYYAPYPYVYHQSLYEPRNDSCTIL